MIWGTVQRATSAEEEKREGDATLKRGRDHSVLHLWLAARRATDSQGQKEEEEEKGGAKRTTTWYSRHTKVIHCKEDEEAKEDCSQVDDVDVDDGENKRHTQWTLKLRTDLLGHSGKHRRYSTHHPGAAPGPS